MANKDFKFDTDCFKYYHDTFVKGPIGSDNTPNTIKGRIKSLETLYNNLQNSLPIPVTSLPSTGVVGRIYRLAGVNSYADYMYAEGALTTPIKMAEYSNAIDNEPIAGSENLAKSGGIVESVNQLYPEGYMSINIPSSDYDSTNSIKFNLKSVVGRGKTVKLQITIKSAGYLAVSFRNGNTESSTIKRASTLYNIGDVITLEGTVDIIQFNNIYFWSPNKIAIKGCVTSSVWSLSARLARIESLLGI